MIHVSNFHFHLKLLLVFAHMINQLNTYEEIDPMHEYDDHILNDL